MEASTRTSMNNNGESSAATEEESGWTTYFEDFFASEKEKFEGDSCTISDGYIGGSPSMISDAASCAPWKFPAMAAAEGRKKLGFKKRKARGVLDDDPLEDTASSPVNSPKVSEMNHLMSLNQRKKDERGHISRAKDIVGFETCTEIRKEEVDRLAVDLKKRGLCLVPLSMLVDYLG
ncbi:uncharacterized protein A4U43_C03F10000 [Asparagus officinalis]|uniref:Uncharacterized protein n=1 Tax=Asparagus officinalis TaxID=4686 RepID=A0A5P1FAL4_ASPOF|nr:uncharacterized protein LOC109832141 [Asparagus officinalis]ONK74773.1 uncharacterized protein A4U43_C03F10000 [Asparagus officinalis]